LRDEAFGTLLMLTHGLPAVRVIYEKFQLSGIEDEHKYWLLTLKIISGSQLKTYVRAKAFGHV
jgi:hypothetical protein